MAKTADDTQILQCPRQVCAAQNLQRFSLLSLIWGSSLARASCLHVSVCGICAASSRNSFDLSH